MTYFEHIKIISVIKCEFQNPNCFKATAEETNDHFSWLFNERDRLCCRFSHFGTTTSMVIRYSESRTKSSFFTMSARLRVNKLPLKGTQRWQTLITVLCLTLNCPQKNNFMIETALYHSSWAPALWSGELQFPCTPQANLKQIVKIVLT